MTRHSNLPAMFVAALVLAMPVGSAAAQQAPSTPIPAVPTPIVLPAKAAPVAEPMIAPIRRIHAGKAAAAAKQKDKQTKPAGQPGAAALNAKSANAPASGSPVTGTQAGKSVAAPASTKSGVVVYVPPARQPAAKTAPAAR